MQFIELESPFAIYDTGDAYVLPNILPEVARDFLKAIEQEPEDAALDSLQKLGRQYIWRKSPVEEVQHLWKFFLSFYLTRTGEDTPSTSYRIEMLRIMLSDGPEEVWKVLRARLLTDIDDISGWSRSFQKEIGEREQIWRGEDGQYYKKENDVVYRVIGSTTLEETRLDFITEQIAREFGVVRHFLQFFALLAISQDFIAHRESYPRTMKALLQGREWPSLAPRWTILQWHPVRTVMWRPWSNLCDSQWLAGDLLASITETLKIEPYQPTRLPDGSEHQLGPDFVRQADFALDTNLRIGEEESVVLNFSGREFRWINASLESDTRVSVGMRKGETPATAEEDLNRLLSLLVWEHRTPVAKKGGPISGAKRTLPLILSPRSLFSLLVNTAAPTRIKLDLIGPTEKLALSLFREAMNSRSVFYAFLNYWKVVEVIFPEKTGRFDWVDKQANLLAWDRERIAEIIKTDPEGLAHHLDVSCRNAIVHVFRPPLIDPDSTADSTRLRGDLPIARNLAAIAMKTLSAFHD